MAIDTNERIAAVATLATDGNLEVVEASPFAARIVTPGAPVMLKTFVFEPIGIAVVELSAPVGRMAASPKLDYWIARISPKLFNVHVAARDLDDWTVVEVRSSLVADEVTVQMLNDALALLALGAAAIARELPGLASPVRSCTWGPDAPAGDLPALQSIAGRGAFASYL